MLSKTIFRVIDGLILCANKLCGIDTINFDGEETDFLMYLFTSDEVAFAFAISALLATILIIVFTVFMIIRSITKDKAEGTPAQIAIKSFKTLLMFFFVPAVMIAFMALGNTFVKALYQATAQSPGGPGTFLFCTFAQDGGMSPEYVEFFNTKELDYTDTTVVSMYMNLSDFPFLFSWLAGGVVLFGIAASMLTFVDRALSIVILYIAAPISLSTSVLDDGARFKLWRDQFLSKFIMGYGMIIAINIYAMVCGIIMKPELVFFSGEGTAYEFLNMIMKLLFIAGGALTMQKSMALIGNLVSAGAGSNELRDNAFSAGSLAKMAGGAALGAAKFAGKTALGAAGLPFKPLKSVISDTYGLWSRNKAASWLGGGDKKDGDKKDKDGDSGATNNEKPEYGSDNNARDAIKNDGFKMSFNTGDVGNANNNKTNDKKNNMVNSAIQNDGGNNNNKSQPQANTTNRNNDQGEQKQQDGGNGQ